MTEKNIVLVGMNHRTAPVELREKLALRCSGDVPYADLRQVLTGSGGREYMVLSTCNRVEFLVVSEDIDLSVNRVMSFISEAFPGQDVRDFLYVFKGRDAVRHIFRVASGLDSMVMGEPQILGQVKEAYRKATLNKTTGVILNRLLHKSFSVAKRVRTETGIGCHAVSVSYAAVELARRIFGSLTDRHVLLIGAGEMAELAAEHLVAGGASKVTVTNRTVERAVEIARRFGASTIPFDQFLEGFAVADIVISSTGSAEPIVRKSDLRPVMRKRKQRPLFIIDIAVPRDVEPEVNDLDNVFLYDIDDLQEVVERNRRKRRKEAELAEHIVEEETVKFLEWLQTLDVVPTIIALRHKAEQIRQQELRKTFSHMPHLSEDDRKAISVMAEAIVKKLLHDPIMFLKNKAARPSREFYVDTVQQIFNLPESDRHPMRSLDPPEPECYESERYYLDRDRRS
ncbi:glutamyl-tRNA reductase [Thermodesulforhabdus norvegica]|uniref:Glutamyl-tRNA reductase n=1 Tax=Thermodesulforhabdus norvegica TaxID=39841 RepID=A0A1I4UV18_9BACT|nr:glutamyl-tRNA reductase [Thermodesulforhabdus norvegica]SFM92766.1 glutamyl-tRNA reductase [Thermodesulforhabdus norvegica]